MEHLHLQINENGEATKPKKQRLHAKKGAAGAIQVLKWKHSVETKGWKEKPNCKGEIAQQKKKKKKEEEEERKKIQKLTANIQSIQTFTVCSTQIDNNDNKNNYCFFKKCLTF